MAAAIICFAGGPLYSQIEVGLAVEPRQALLYEPIHARVTIHNNTGGILNFDAGNNAARFNFEISRGRNEAVGQLDRGPLLSGTKLVPAGRLTNVVCLTSLYSMQTRGQYKIKACVEWNNALFVSSAVNLEILKGFEIARMITGVPGEPGAMRLYVLEYLPKHNGEYVYLLIEEEQSRKIYGMFNLGRIVRVRKPEMKMDEAGNMHVLFQSTAMVFCHTAFTPYGVQLFSRSYADKSNKIYLVNMPNGHISVPPAYYNIKSVPVEEKPSQGPQDSSADLPAGKARPGRGGLLGPKTE